jgi:hypothetical protein
MIIIENNLSNSNFDLIFSSPEHKSTCFAMKDTRGSTDIAYFLVDLRGVSSLYVDSTTTQIFAGIFSRRILNLNWKVESISFSMLQVMLNSCPKDQVAALSESLLTQFKAYEPDLIQVPIRSQMESLLRSYIPTEAPERNLA